MSPRIAAGLSPEKVRKGDHENMVQTRMASRVYVTNRNDGTLPYYRIIPSDFADLAVDVRGRATDDTPSSRLRTIVQDLGTSWASVRGFGLKVTRIMDSNGRDRTIVTEWVRP